MVGHWRPRRDAASEAQRPHDDRAELPRRNNLSADRSVIRLPSLETRKAGGNNEYRTFFRDLLQLFPEDDRHRTVYIEALWKFEEFLGSAIREFDFNTQDFSASPTRCERNARLVIFDFTAQP